MLAVDSTNGASIFAIAIGADAPFAFRLTDSFNLLVGVGADYTVVGDGLDHQPRPRP